MKTIGHVQYYTEIQNSYVTITLYTFMLKYSNNLINYYVNNDICINIINIFILKIKFNV